MNVSLKWLAELVDYPNANELVQKFNLHSQEIESLTTVLETKGLVVGLVKDTKSHPDADKLRVCQVDIGAQIHYKLYVARRMLLLAKKWLLPLSEQSYPDLKSKPQPFAVWKAKA
jgi:hypothetical protein